MKTFAIFTVIAWTSLFAGSAAWATQPPAPVQEERKLEGDELAEFYLRQILEQAEDEPIEFEQRDLMQELNALVDQLGEQHRLRLAQRKAEAEQRAAELKAKAEQQAAEARARAEQEDRQPSASDRTPGNADHAAVVHLKPVVVEGAGVPLAIVPERAAVGLVRPTVANAPREPAEQMRGLLLMLDQVIARLQAVRAWLSSAANAS